MAGATPSPDPMVRWQALNREHARVQTALDRALLRAHHLSGCEVMVLQQLSDHTDGVRIQELSELVLRSQSTLSRMVGRLDAEGLVNRSTDGADRRGTLTRLTPEGERRLEEAIATARRVLSDLLP